MFVLAGRRRAAVPAGRCRRGAASAGSSLGPEGPGYIDTRWQNSPYFYWMIHHHWPPNPPGPLPPYPPVPPYPYPYYPYPVYDSYPGPGSSGYTYVPNPNQPGTDPTTPPSTAVLPAPKTNQAVVCVVLPTTAAIVWFDGHKTSTELSATRVFNTPELAPGKTYYYTVKAEWVQRGRNVSAERSVSVTATQTTLVDFTKPADKK